MDFMNGKSTEDDADEFYFESDHLALKGNKDYMNLLRNVIVLEARRTQSIQDLDRLMSCRAEALKDPISFVARLQNADSPEFPECREIPEIPSIDWSQYNIAGPDTRMRPQTRHENKPITVKNEVDDGKILVRGRAFDESKPVTFNQLWTDEEQRRLDELLVQFPPEEVEMRRWTKIANALGNRTPKQVSSRCQKYFLKLGKAQMPVLGRVSRMRPGTRKNVHYRHQRHNHLLFRRSTFFPHQDFMDGDRDGEMEVDRTREMEINTGDDSNPGRFLEDNNSVRSTDQHSEYNQIRLLKSIKAEKEEQSGNLYQHFGYKCVVCREEPIKGTRWHCSECPDAVDLCGDCVVAQLDSLNPAHPPIHRLTAIRELEGQRNYDSDYLPQSFDNSSYNYLDPNFLPE